MSHVLACARVRVDSLPPDHLPVRFFETLEQNQKIESCCRHPENHDIEAWYSNEQQKEPDVYIFHCTCGRRHRRLMVGTGERPTWDVR